MEVSTASRALLTIAASLSCSTMIGSTRMPDWNLISSMAGRSVGSETARNSRLPRRTRGSTWCLASRRWSTDLTASMSRSMASRSRSGHAEFGGGGHGDLAGLDHLAAHQVGHEGDALGLGALERLQDRVLGDQAVLHEPPGEAAQGGIGGGNGHKVLACPQDPSGAQIGRPDSRPADDQPWSCAVSPTPKSGVRVSVVLLRNPGRRNRPGRHFRGFMPPRPRKSGGPAPVPQKGKAPALRQGPPVVQ